MRKLTAEQQTRVDRLMLEAKGLYESIRRAKVPKGLAESIGDDVPFDKLNNKDIEAIALVVAECRKLDWWPKPSAAASPKNENGAGALVPDEVIPPAAPAADSST